MSAQERFSHLAQLTKIDVEKRLVYARAAQEVKDKVNETFDYAESVPYFKTWSQSQLGASLGKSAGNVRAMHKDIAAGIVIPNGITFNDDERAIDVCIRVVDDAEWAKCEAGVYTGISIGGRYAKKWADPSGQGTRYAGDPSEISLVDRPMIPTATFFDVQKSDGTVEKRKFVPCDVPLFSEGKDLGIVVKSDELPEPGKEFAHEGQYYILKKLEDEHADVEVVYTVSGTPAELGAFAKLLGTKGLTIAEATAQLAKFEPPAPAKTEQDADVLALAAQMAYDADKSDFKKLEADAQAPYLAAALEQLSKKVAERSDVNPSEGTEKYGSNADFADETNHKYPLKNADHVKAALSYWGMAKNRTKYSAADQAKIGGKINAAAKKFGIGDADAKKIEGQFNESVSAVALALAKADGLDMGNAGVVADPANQEKITGYIAKAEAAVEPVFLRKGLATCGSFAYVINSLCSIAESCEMETASEGDGSDMCDRLYALIAELGECLKDMVQEEIEEEVEDDGDDRAVHANMMAMGAKLDGLKKRIEPFLKKGDGVAMQTQRLHDRCVGMGAQCQKSANAGGDLTVAAANKSELVVALMKVEPTLTLEKAEAIIKVMPQAQQPADAGKMAKLEQENADLQGRMKKLEAQPAPLRIVARTSLVPVGKEDEGSSAGRSDPAMEKIQAIVSQVDPVRKVDGSIDEAATAVKVMQKLGGVNVMPARPAKR